MGLSFTKYVDETFRDQIIEAAEAIVKETNYREIPTQVTRASVWQIDLNKLYTFDDYVELPIIITVTVKSTDDGSDYYNKLYMRGMISGTFSAGLCDFRIKLKEVLKREPRKTEMKVTDDLLLKSHTMCMTSPRRSRHRGRR